MRRITRCTAQSVPPKLRSFEWTEWGATPGQGLQVWSRARSEYYTLHPDAWANPLAMLAGFANVKAKLLGRVPPYPKHDEGSPSLR